MPQADNSRGGVTRARKAKKKKPSPGSDAAQGNATAPKPRVRKAPAKPKPFTPPPTSQHDSRTADAGRKRVRRAARREERRNRGKSDAASGGSRQMERAQAYVRKGYERKFGDKAAAVARLVDPSGKPAVLADRALDVAQRRAKDKLGSLDAPALKVLDQTTRPVHGVAAGTRAAIKGQNVGKAVVKGVKLEDRSLFSDVLKDAGVEKLPGGKTIAAVGGFGLDVVLDPTTYVTGGTGAVAKKSAQAAAKQATKKAVKAGLSPEQAARMGERAAKQAVKGAPTTRGVTVKVAGKEVPGVRKTSAKAGERTGRVIRKVTPSRARTGGRNVLADVNPDVTPTGATKGTHQHTVRATRTARAKASQGRDRAQKRALAVKRKVSREDYNRIIDALELEAVSVKAMRRAIAELPPELREVAVRIRADLRHSNKQRKQSGIKGGERKGYVPRQLTDEALEAEGKKAKGSGTKTIRPGYGKARSEQRPMREVREEMPGRYSEDLPSLVANRVAQGSEDSARAGLNRRLADIGQTVKRGQPVDLKAGEAVFHIKGSDIRKVDEDEVERVLEPLKPVIKNGKVVRLSGDTEARKALAARLHKQGKSQDEIAAAISAMRQNNVRRGRYVILNEEVVKRATEGVTPKLDFTDKGIVKGYDRMQAGFKRVALATPGYHVRNLVGDSFNAFLGQPGQRLPGNIARSGRVLKAAGRRDKANLKMLPVTPKKGTMKTGRYGRLTYDQIAEGLAQAGAFRTGFTAKEIPELAQSGKTGVKVNRVAKGRVAQGVKRAFLNREDLPRVATAVEALRRGATWEEAAEYVAQHHFDYQHLTQFERNVARRLAPFYTFTARNIPLQTRKLVTNPGKFAQYEKLRQEMAKATGIDEDARQARTLYTKLEQAGVKLPDGWEKYLTDWEKRNAGVPVNWKGNQFTVSFALPLMDLSQVPGAAGKRQLQEYFEKAMSMATPLLKNPTEYFSNYSFFFKDQIQREWSPNVAAPAYVGAFPEELKGKLGVTRIRDKRSGEMVWGWPAKVDYVAKSVPGTPAFVQNMMTGGGDRRGRHDMERVLGFMGVKAVPIDPVTNAVNLAYARMDEIAERKGSLNQQGVSAENPTAEYSRLLGQERLLREIAGTGKQMRGDAVLPSSVKKSKPTSSLDVLRKSSSSGGSSGFSVSDYSKSSSGGSGGFQVSSYR